MLVTNPVLLEIGNAQARNYKEEAVRVIEHFLISKETEVVHLTPELFAEAFSLYKVYKDKAWGLVDCVSFVVMRKMGITSVLTSIGILSRQDFRCSCSRRWVGEQHGQR